MLNLRTGTVFAFGLVVCGFVSGDCLADVTFLTPTPYLSAADSPFPVDGSNPNFYLEDFEDGELNTPGICFGNMFAQVQSPTGAVMVPSVDTDSVDGDDGVIDGSGQLGHSCASVFFAQTDSVPPSTTWFITLEFDAGTLGFLPNTFGFVWTDARSDFGLSFRVTTAQDDTFGSPMVTGIFDANRDGGTSEDRFVGVYCPEGIASIGIYATYHGDISDIELFEIDHVQYGLLVPEPSSGVLVVLAIGSLLGLRGRLGAGRG